MPPQIEATIRGNENEKADLSSSSDNEMVNIFNIRKYLLILLLLQWLIFFLTFALGIYSIVIQNTVDNLNGIQSLLPIIVLVIYYTFGLLVTYKQYRVGLLIFASIGIILLILACILLGYILLAVVALSIGFGNTSQSYEIIIFLCLLFIAVVIIGILTLKFSFGLAKLLKQNDYSSV